MTEQLQLEIITSHEKLMESKVDWVTIPGSEGELGILPNHVPLVTALDTGIVQIGVDGGVQKVAVHYGYAQVSGNSVIILSEMAESAEKVDVERAKDAETRARDTLREMVAAQEEESARIDKYEAKLSRALVRQSLTG